MNTNTTNPPSVTLVTRPSKIFTPSAHEWDVLPFVAPPPTGGMRDFWAPRSTGRYAYDCDMGIFYGRAALPFLRQPGDGPQLLRMMVMALADHGDKERDRGVIVGLFGVIGEAVVRGLAERA